MRLIVLRFVGWTRFVASSGLLALLGFLFIIGATPAHAEETVALTALDLSTVTQGFGKPQIDKAIDGHPLRLAGRTFAHGLGTHSPGDFLIDLDGQATRFSAWVGIDDETNKRGSAEFQIVGDGKLLFDSGILRGGQEPKRVDIALTGFHHLALLVGDGGDGFDYDHADWAEATFTFNGMPPRAAAAPVPSTPTIAMPDTTKKPHITTPAVFGVQPDRPVLFTISATGKRPLTYAVTDLPKGLRLDPVTGLITGTLKQSGRRTLTVSARNSTGSDTRKMDIVVGDTIALTPPLGWNSYDCFGDNVTEAEILANARYFQANLLPHGWQYVIVDYRWYDPDALRTPNNPNAPKTIALAMDANGRLVPAPNRFPSAARGQGFAPLAEQIHALGMKFGIHIMRGISRQAVQANLPIEGSSYRAADAANKASVCPWCPDMYGVDAAKPAGQAWYDSLLRQYASWGVDYIKVDDMSAPYSTLEIEAVHKAIAKCGRSILFSLSPGDTPLDDAKHVETQANLWRISGDFWDDWSAVNHQFDLIGRWQGYGGAGHWPDADMIPLGHLSVQGRSVGPDRQTHLTQNEQLTLMSLWALAPSPLMLGMNLPDNDPWTLALLTNDEVLSINQDALGKQATRITIPGALASTDVWVRQMADGSTVIGLFNRLRLSMPLHFRWSDVGLQKVTSARDVWKRQEIKTDAEAFQTTLGPHGAMLLRVKSK